MNTELENVIRQELTRPRDERRETALARALAARRSFTEAPLLRIVDETRDVRDMPRVAVHALALMPSCRAERVFVRVLLAPPHDARTRRYAEQGLRKLAACRAPIRRAPGEVRGP
jgi:hypothetical protein